MRYVPALVGGLLPLVALLFRAHLSDGETVALAGFLAANPVLLYYSRFMRGDPLVGAFMFGAFALFLRTLDTWQPRYLLAGTGVTALGVTVKENAPVYVLCWLGAAALVAWLRLLAARTKRERPVAGLLARYDPRARGAAAPDGGYSREDLFDGAARVLGVGLLAAVEFLVVVIYFYAPRSSDPNEGFDAALTDPSLLPGVVEAATVGSFRKFYGLWIAGGTSDHAYLPYLADLAGTVAYGASVLCLFALVGFLLESARMGGPRGVVIGCFAWGVASLLGYPIITDIKAPWAAVHVVLPLAVPAAVGLAATVRGGRAASAADRESLAVGGALVLAFAAISAGFVGYWGYHTSYANPQAPDNELVQYAQPADDIHPEMAALDRLAADGGTGAGGGESDPDVLIYGSSFVEEDPPAESDWRPACARWFNVLPLPWYFERSEADVTCARNASALPEEAPPMIVAKVEDRPELERRYPDYEATTKKLRTTDTEVVFLIDRSRLDGEDTAERADRSRSRGSALAPRSARYPDPPTAGPARPLRSG